VITLPLKTLRSLALISLCGPLWMAAACSRAPTEPLSAKALGDATVHPGFNYATLRNVDVKLTSAKAGSVALSNLDGKLIFSGAISPSLPLHLTVPIANKDDKLVASLHAGGAISSVELSIVSGAVSHAFSN